MPHLIVEYSDNLTNDTSSAVDITALLSDLHAALDGRHNIAAPRIKARAIPLAHYMVGEHGTQAAMVHVCLKLLEGRSVAARKELSLLLQQTVRAYVPLSSFPESAVTVEVVELETATYCA